MAAISYEPNRVFFLRAKDWIRFLFRVKRQHVVRQKSIGLLCVRNLRKVRSWSLSNKKCRHYKGKVLHHVNGSKGCALAPRY